VSPQQYLNFEQNNTNEAITHRIMLYYSTYTLFTTILHHQIPFSTFVYLQNLAGKKSKDVQTTK